MTTPDNLCHMMIWQHHLTMVPEVPHEAKMAVRGRGGDEAETHICRCVNLFYTFKVNYR